MATRPVQNYLARQHFPPQHLPQNALQGASQSEDNEYYTMHESTAAARLKFFTSANHDHLHQPIAPPIAEPPNWHERRIVAHYRTLRARIHDGPFYTILDSAARVSKTGHRSPPQAHFDPFEGAQTYSQRFVRKRNTLPHLSTRPFVKDFFPRELWSTLDPTGKGDTKKSLHLQTRTKQDKWAASLANLGGDDEDAEGNADDENEVEDEDGNKDDGEKEGEEEDPDQFDEDDEDDGDDYNAENYFDGGDDDDFGGDEGGGDGDDY